MDPENDNGPSGRDQPIATSTDAAPASVAPPRPAPAAAYRMLTAVPAAEVMSLSRDPAASMRLALPLPLVPSRYVVDQTAAALTLEQAEPRFLKPSVTATLPPPQIEVLPAPAQVLSVMPDAAPPIDVSRLSLAPEAHVATRQSIAFGRDPGAVAPAQAPQQLRIPEPVVPIPPPAFSRQAAPAANGDALSVVPDVAAPIATPRSAGHYLKSAAKFLVYAAVAWLGLIAFLILAYRVVNPPMSSLMLQQWISGQAIQQSWADIDEISPQVVRAVLLSEDGRFCEHTGVDFDAMQDAIEKAGDGAPRGASTISMQVVKNLFLWPSKSYVRKAIEIPLTWAMELIWPKRRIMEIYLNIAEWGPGIFGVEAASQFHFQKSARRLNEREAAQLAVSLPNPYMRDAGDPGPKTRRLASDIQARMRNAYASQTSCVLRAGAGR